MTSTCDAEYFALTQLQGDAFITLDEDLSRAVERVVTHAPIDELLTSAAPPAELAQVRMTP
jgi:hypothetical protein